MMRNTSKPAQFTARYAGGLPLCIVKIGGHGNHRFTHRLMQGLLDQRFFSSIKMSEDQFNRGVEARAYFDFDQALAIVINNLDIHKTPNVL